MQNHLFIKHLLEKSIDELAATPSRIVVDPNRDFTRNRKLNLKDTINLLLTMEGDCIQEELFRYFGRNESAPSKASFYKQRQKLADNAIPALFYSFNEKLSTKLYNKKYQLVACDGSTAEIYRDPNDRDSFFDSPKVSSTGFNLIYINAMYSILDNRFTNFVLQPGRKQNEHDAFRSMVDEAGTSHNPIIYFGDKNYTSYNNFAHVIENKQFFLIRATDQKIKGILGKPIDNLYELDCHVDLIMTKSNSRKHRIHPDLEDRYRFIHPRTPFEYIDKTNPEYDMSLRIVRFELQDGSFENIITNLPDIEFDIEDFKELYHLRWNEETAFRNIKHVLRLTDFHSKKYKYVIQEIWARAILYNFSSAIISECVIEKKNTIYKYQVNYTEAYKTCREFLRFNHFKRQMNVPDLIARCVEPIRPERSFARQHRNKHPFSFWYRS